MEQTSKPCRRCSRTLPLDAYRKNARCADGLDPTCRDCCNEKRRAKWASGRASILATQRSTNKKACKKCGETLPLDHFPRSHFSNTRSLGEGRAGSCFQCSTKRARDNHRRTLKKMYRGEPFRREDCGQCGKALVGAQTAFCGNKCRAAFRSRREERPCANDCGKIIVGPPSRFPDGVSVTCSDKCRDDHNGKSRRMDVPCAREGCGNIKSWRLGDIRYALSCRSDKSDTRLWCGKKCSVMDTRKRAISECGGFALCVGPLCALESPDGRWMSASEFRATSKGYMSSYCVSCMSMNQRLSKYAMTFDEFVCMYRSQGGKCSVCRCDFLMRKQGGGRGPSKDACNIDHCHDTGRNRSLMCSMCNPAEGMLKTAAAKSGRTIVEVAEAMLAYVTEHANGGAPKDAPAELTIL